MTTANKITIVRVVLIPVLVLLMYLNFPGHIYWALAVFIIASISDFLDGYIARHYNQVSDFGKFMDPLADKMLTTTAIIYLVKFGFCHEIVLIIVLIKDGRQDARKHSCLFLIVRFPWQDIRLWE